LEEPELCTDPRFASNENAGGQQDRVGPHHLGHLTGTHKRLLTGYANSMESGTLGLPRKTIILISSVSRVPLGPINNIEETFEHPQAQARGMVVEVEVCLIFNQAPGFHG
jgi:hypothetical protein